MAQLSAISNGADSRGYTRGHFDQMPIICTEYPSLMRIS